MEIWPWGEYEGRGVSDIGDVVDVGEFNNDTRCLKKPATSPSVSTATVVCVTEVR